MNLQEGHDISGNKAFILGGSGDIGRSIAEKLIARGCITTIHGRSAEKVARICKELAARTGVAAGTAIPCSFTINSVEDCITEVMRHEPIDILVLAYGPFCMTSIEESTTEVWREMVEKNLTLPGALISALAPQMAKRGGGRMVLFGNSTIRSVRGVVNTVAYSAAKAGVEVLARSLSRTYAARGVAVHVVYPSYVNSDGGKNIQHLQERTDIRIFTPQDVADTVIWQLTAPAQVVSCTLQELSE